MLLSNEKKLLFIHVYKNGGMSIRAALLPQIRKPHQRIWSRVAKVAGIPCRLDPEPFPRYSTASDVMDVIGEKRFARYFSFAIVRNP